MNKQGVIEKIKRRIDFFSSEGDYDRGCRAGLDSALLIFRELDEPEKPVIPQYMAEWLEVCKDNLALSLANSMNPIVMRTNNQPEKTIHWLKFVKNQEIFAKAWLFGYEVQNEKLYKT